ncbi:DUF2254 domain-containing protein [Microvirga antarctica]|uniref:DUF2254 domain-containing protein n=1 Tax=Microvirga antarctica TaxID=2819233 RepID=UPI001B30605C|nr:DUF2254 domain-containing protein [Microvirga antarctica]
MGRFRNILARLRGQLWIIPLAISGFSLVLAYWILTSGAFLFERGTTGSGLWWLYGGDAQSARGLLSSLLSGLMTMTSLIVSMTFVILTLSANQLGPRLITTFMADRQIQTVLGLFLGTILYVLVILRSLDETLGAEGVPHIAVTIGSALTIVCLFALLFYVHKIARSIIADNVVERIAGDLRRNLGSMLKESDGDLEENDGDASEGGPEGACVATIALNHVGYIQVVDYDRLVAVAKTAKTALQVNVRAGHFLLHNGEHVLVFGNNTLNDDEIDEVRRAFVIGPERSPAQDLEYGLRQLVEIALRALSPGINDPYTAIAVVNQLGAALEDILGRPLPRTRLRDAAGEVRVIAKLSDFAGLVDAAFDAIRQAGSSTPAVLIRIADVLGDLSPILRTEAAQHAVVVQLDKLAETAERAPVARCDRADIVARICQARKRVASENIQG